MNRARIKTIILNNWQLKLLATALAVLVFYGIRGATSFEVPYDIPLKVDVGQGIAILDQPKTVRVVFRGSQEDLRRLNQNEIVAVIKPKAIDPGGSERVSIKPGDIMGDFGVRVEKIEPRSVVIAFDREIEKVVAVARPPVIGTPLIGKVELDYQPRSVKIRGSALRLQNKEEVTTEPVDVDGRVESFTKRVKVLDAWVTKVQPPEITVNVNILTESVTREWTNVAVSGILAPGAVGPVQFQPAVVKILLKGRADEIRRMTNSEVMAFADCTRLAAGVTTNVTVKVHLPLGVDVEGVVEPAVVKAIIGDK